MSKVDRLFAVTIAAVALLGCGDAFAPEDAVGEYVATRLVFSGAESGDFLAEGGRIQLTLTADGRTTGSMVVPASLSEDGTEVTLDLTGTFAVADDVVTFDHAADTFIRDSQWRADGNTLRAMETFSGTTVEAVLTKQ